MNTVLSEYPLSPDHELNMPGDVLWIEGVGPIGQYYNYWDALWEKGIPYFVRDVYLSQLNDIEFKMNELSNKYNDLNSKIQTYECR